MSIARRCRWMGDNRQDYFKMEIKRKYFEMFVRQMVVHQLLDEYRKDGYEIKEQYPIGMNLRADIYGVKDGERVILEIKDKRARLENIEKIRETAQKEGIRFIIVDISDIKIEEDSK